MEVSFVRVWREIDGSGAKICESDVFEIWPLALVVEVMSPL